MHVSSWATILLSMSLEATSLFGVMESISSMNRIHGEELCKGEKQKSIKFREKDIQFNSVYIPNLPQRASQSVHI